MPTKNTRSHDALRRPAAPHGAPERSTAPQGAVVLPPRILALAGQKGGAGKTTVAISVAVESMARGRRVLVIDADPQGSGRLWASAAADLGTEIPTVVGMALGAQTAAQVLHLASGYDLTVIDCPPQLDAVQRAAMMLSHRVLLPCGPSLLDVGSLGRSIDLVKEAQASKPGLRAALVITRRQHRTTVGREVRAALEASGVPVLRAECTFRVTYQEMIAAGMGPTTFAPKSAAADEVRALVTELEGLR